MIVITTLTIVKQPYGIGNTQSSNIPAQTS